MSETDQIRQVLAVLDPAPLWASLAKTPPATWLVLFLGPALTWSAPWIRRLWPSFGGGASVLWAPLSRPLSRWAFWRSHFWTTGFPTLMGGVLLATRATDSPLLLLGGVSCLVWTLFRERTLRTRAEFLEHAWRVDGRFQTYDTLVAVERVEGGWELRTKDVTATLTEEQYAVLRPFVCRKGIGAGPELIGYRESELDLK